MLSAKEFTAGTLADAKPLSLMLPRSKYERAFLIGSNDTGPVAVCLSEDHTFFSFECSTNTNWKGLILPNVSVEVDETRLSEARELGSVVRTNTHLAIYAKTQHPSQFVPIILESGLPSANNETVNFSKWRIVIEQGYDKKVLWEVDVSEPTHGA